MQTELDNYLSVALKRLEKAYSEILKTQGFSADAEKVKMIEELVKEQVQDENSSSATR